MNDQGDSHSLSAAQGAILDIVLNLIVPPDPQTHLPGAAEVGVADHLRTLAADCLPTLREEIDQLEQQACERFAIGFAALSEHDRQILVDEARLRDPSFMSRLALETMTCYYQHDRVLEALGMELRAPSPKGYEVIPGDLMLLAPVRRRGKLYRDA